MSDWEKFKTAGSEYEERDSKSSLISALIFTTFICGFLGGVGGFLVVAYIANSNDHQVATMFASSNDILSYERIQAIIGGGVLIGLAVGFVAGLKMFTPHLFSFDDEKVVQNKSDDPFDDDMRG